MLIQQYTILRSYMKKLIGEGQAEILPTAKLIVPNTFCGRYPFSLPLAVQSQVSRWCTPPKGPLRPPEQPGCYRRRSTGRKEHFALSYIALMAP